MHMGMYAYAHCACVHAYAKAVMCTSSATELAHKRCHVNTSDYVDTFAHVDTSADRWRAEQAHKERWQAHCLAVVEADAVPCHLREGEGEDKGGVSEGEGG